MEKVCKICGIIFKSGEALNKNKNLNIEFLITSKRKKIAKGKIIGLISAILIILGLSYFSFISITGRVAEPTYDNFAQCLSEKGATFYGTFWCPYCKKQKELFGPSAKFLNYVECDPRGKNARPELCRENDIKAYPTWIINGERYEGLQSLQRLSELTGCELPNKEP